MKKLLSLTFICLLLLFFASGLLTGCTKNKIDNSCGVNCSSVGICTAVYISFSVKVKNSDGSAYKLDSFVTVRMEDNKILDIKKDNSSYSDSVNRGNGLYLVFSDAFGNLTDQCGKEFNFIGYKNNIEVVNEKYVFNHDCCHIQFVSGKREITK